MVKPKKASKFRQSVSVLNAQTLIKQNVKSKKETEECTNVFFRVVTYTGQRPDDPQKARICEKSVCNSVQVTTQKIIKTCRFVCNRCNLLQVTTRLFDNSIRNINKVELESLPILARAASLRFLLTRLYDEIHNVKSELVITKDPNEYFEKLKFHQKVKSVDEYGI